ncbi:MAG TPA: methanogenesis marker 6 protein [Methanomassiliicoccaceae archaeon]|jgi:putative methanogenesis marker protein 6|nr:methanogenesis marker 6 protein [Methanomassiliicoccaceae archaeon]
MILIAPSSDLTPDQLSRFIHGLGYKITIKETCYGANIEGDKELIRKVVSEVRKLDPNRIFTKMRAYPIGDERRCRAHHGSRPGFNQIEKEWMDLPLIEAGLCAVEGGEKCPEKPPRKKLSVESLMKIAEEMKE